MNETFKLTIGVLSHNGPWGWGIVDMVPLQGQTKCSCCDNDDDFFFVRNGIFVCITCTGKAKMMNRKRQ